MLFEVNRWERDIVSTDFGNCVTHSVHFSVLQVVSDHADQDGGIRSYSFDDSFHFVNLVTKVAHSIDAEIYRCL